MSSIRLSEGNPVVNIATNNKEAIEYLDSKEIKDILNKYQANLTISDHPGLAKLL